MIRLLRSLFPSDIWKELWIALRRSRRDASARRNLILIILSLALGAVIGLAYIGLRFGWYLYQLRSVMEDPEGKRFLVILAIAILVMLGVVAVVRLLWEWRKRILWKRREQDRDEGPVALQRKLAIYREACLLAVLLERLESEVGLEKELPEGFTVMTRRVLLDRLAELKMRYTLEPWLLDILLAPDGHWPEHLKVNARPAWECLAVLRWVLGMSELRALTTGPRYSYADAHAVLAVVQPETLSLLRAWQIRVERDSTELFLNRCWSEMVARHDVPDCSQEELDSALRVRRVIQSEGYTADFLVGASTILELSSPLLWFIANQAYNRLITLSLMVDITSGKLPASALRDLFARFFAASSPSEAEPAPEASK